MSITETETPLTAKVTTEIAPIEVSAAAVSAAEGEAAGAPVLPLAVPAAEVSETEVPASHDHLQRQNRATFRGFDGAN